MAWLDIYTKTHGWINRDSIKTNTCKKVFDCLQKWSFEPMIPGDTVIKVISYFSFIDRIAVTSEIRPEAPHSLGVACDIIVEPVHYMPYIAGILYLSDKWNIFLGTFWIEKDSAGNINKRTNMHIHIDEDYQGGRRENIFGWEFYNGPLGGAPADPDYPEQGKPIKTGVYFFDKVKNLDWILSTQLYYKQWTDNIVIPYTDYTIPTGITYQKIIDLGKFDSLVREMLTTKISKEDKGKIKPVKPIIDLPDWVEILKKFLGSLSTVFIIGAGLLGLYFLSKIFGKS